jgi:hypothetical protein
MLLSETVARTKWCPFIRLDNSNRLFNTNTDGFENTNRMYHCIGSSCMSWREFHLSHIKGGLETGEKQEPHGYCGLAGRPELEDTW